MCRILVIDDDINVREAIASSLHHDGHKAFSTASCRQALEIQNQTPMDIVITDIFMPEQDGLETIVKMRRNFPYLKIIAMTGGDKNKPIDYLKCAEEFGANATLAKPFSRSDLRLTVEGMLAR